MTKPSPETPPDGFDITHSEAPGTLAPGDFQSRLSATMERLGLTAQGAADYLGVPVTTIRKWIDGTRTPGAAVIRLLDVLGIVEAIAPSIHAAMLPTTAIDPGQSGQSVKPVDPGQSVKPVDPGQSSQSGQSVKPVDPGRSGSIS